MLAGNYPQFLPSLTVKVILAVFAWASAQQGVPDESSRRVSSTNRLAQTRWGLEQSTNDYMQNARSYTCHELAAFSLLPREVAELWSWEDVGVLFGLGRRGE